MRKVEVMAYNERWARMFSEEEARLNDIFGNEIIATYHIGSTSVVGLSAKRVIDIMPVVRDINHVDEFNESMVITSFTLKVEKLETIRHFLVNHSIRYKDYGKTISIFPHALTGTKIRFVE
ncbi:GrpB family protein [Shouchella sp. 1P09AA]|uniref:GrpB family protein n=1 Tax=unclassified Shouchella TaxID=2893065 RepID=UPI0039A1AB2D